MARVSLKEAYDNKDVVAQIYAIRDIAEGASDTADSAKTTADDAKTYVDTLGVQVEGAVQTANNASASAQESAETVSQYDARLTEVEGNLNQAESDIDDLETGLNAVTLRVTTAEGNIVTIQGRVTALETADGQNVKINDINAYAVGLTGVQTAIAGSKTFTSPLTVDSNGVGVPFFVKTKGNARMINLIAKDYDVTDGNQHYLPSVLSFDDANGVTMFRIGAFSYANGRVQIKMYARNSDGTFKESVLIEGNTV